MALWLQVFQPFGICSIGLWHIVIARSYYYIHWPFSWNITYGKLGYGILHTAYLYDITYDESSWNITYRTYQDMKYQNPSVPKALS